MMWGINVLSPSAPFTEALDYDENVRKIIVLMTDGDNTMRYNEPDGYHVETSIISKLDESDADSLELCDYAKNNEVTIYTVGLSVASARGNDLLRDCATIPENFYSADNSGELAKVFGEIARKINNVRLVK